MLGKDRRMYVNSYARNKGNYVRQAKVVPRALKTKLQSSKLALQPDLIQ